jgi:hypothetical protein
MDDLLKVAKHNLDYALPEPYHGNESPASKVGESVVAGVNPAWGPSARGPLHVSSVQEASYKRLLRAALASVGFRYAKASKQSRHSMNIFVHRRIKFMRHHVKQWAGEIKHDCVILREAALTGELDTVVVQTAYQRLVPTWWSRNCNLTYKMAMQLSYIKRALPKPSEYVGIESQSDQRAMLTGSPFIVTERFRGSLVELGQWIGPIQPKYDIAFSNAACVEYPRKEGGRARATVELLEDENFSPQGFMSATMPDAPLEYPDPFGSGITHFFTKAVTPLFKDISFMAEHDSFGHESLPVPELGWKVRMVSKSPARLVLASEAYRKPLLRKVCEKFGDPVSNPLQDRYSLPISNVVLADFNNGRRRIYSSDLSKATDTLSVDAILAVCQGCQIPLQFVTGGKLDGREIVRGTLMGIPCSWPILSAIHAHIAWRVDKSKSFLIKGDDLIAVWTFSQVKRYRRLMGGVGFIVKGDFFGKYGIFAERPFRVHNRLLEAFSFWGVFPLRWIQCDSSGYTREGIRVPLAPILQVGDTVRALIARGADRAHIIAVQQITFYRDQAELRKMSVLPYLPVWLGGLGFECLNPKKLVPGNYAKVLTHFMNHPSLYIERDIRISLRGKTPLDAVLMDVAAFSYSPNLNWTYVPKGRDPTFPRYGGVPTDIIARVMSTMAAFYITCSADYSKPHGVGTWKLMSELKKVNKLIGRVAMGFPLAWSYADAYDFPGRIYPDGARVPILFCGGHRKFIKDDELESYIFELLTRSLPIESEPRPYGRGLVSPLWGATTIW